MGVRSFFRLPQYNVFDFKPRYYDPEKEERREKLNEMRQAAGKPALDENGQVKPGSTIKGSFRPKMTRKAYRNRNSTIRLLVIAFILFFVAYLILAADLSSVIKLFSK